jgi:hypothetical protein
VIYCGKENQYLPYLPSIQEKLVELFKLSLSELVHAEVNILQLKCSSINELNK